MKILTATHPGRDTQGQNKVNQDRLLVQQPFLDPQHSLFAAFDGHGFKGDEVAQFVKDYIPPLIMKNLGLGHMKDTLQRSYQDLQTILSQRIDFCKASGTTSSLVLVQDQMAYLSWVGDSKVVLGIQDPKLEQDQCVALEITHDHKLDVPSEQERIYSHKGTIKPYNSFDEGPLRVWPGGLAMSRSLGDLVAHKFGVTEQPEFRQFQITEELKYMVIATDGVWEYVSPQRVINILQQARSLEDGVREVMQTSKSMWQYFEEGAMDDISLIVVEFQNQEEPNQN